MGVLEEIKKWEEKNKSHLMGLSMVPPPLDEWPNREDNELDEDLNTSNAPSETSQKSAETNPESIKQETLEEASKDSERSEKLDSRQTNKDLNAKPCVTCSYLESCVTCKATDYLNIKSCRTCGGHGLKECCLRTIKVIDTTASERRKERKGNQSI